MTTTLKKEIKTLVAQSVREVLRAEMANLRASFLNIVSPREMKDIEKRYRRPSRSTARSISTKF
jgi:hypothetical protein